MQSFEEHTKVHCYKQFSTIFSNFIKIASFHRVDNELYRVQYNLERSSCYIVPFLKISKLDAFNERYIHEI